VQFAEAQPLRRLKMKVQLKKVTTGPKGEFVSEETITLTQEEYERDFYGGEIFAMDRGNSSTRNLYGGAKEVYTRPFVGIS
jgi:hypothetical protein